MSNRATYRKHARPVQVTVYRASVERWTDTDEPGTIGIKYLDDCPHEHRTPEAAERCADSIIARDRKTR